MITNLFNANVFPEKSGGHQELASVSPEHQVVTMRLPGDHHALAQLPAEALQKQWSASGKQTSAAHWQCGLQGIDFHLTYSLMNASDE